MIDIRELRADPEAFRKRLGKKRYDASVLDAVASTDGRWREVLAQVESLRNQKNAASKEIGKVPPDQRAAKIAQSKKLGDDLAAREKDLAALEEERNQMLIRIPNPPHESVPDADTEEGNQVVRTVGEPRHLDFKPRDHVELGELAGALEIERASRLSGSRFAYLTGDLVWLQMALFRLALDRLHAAGFKPVVPPVLVRERAMFGTGFFPADRNEIYKLEGEDLFLVGTSEVSLAALHMEETVPEADLPLRYAGLSTCFRREAGTYGKDTRGIFRVHQFDKVEMFSFTHPSRSWEEHERILAVQEEIIQALGLAYRVVNIAAGDLGWPAAKKYDLEAWLPGQKAYRELTSCSNCTDYQARRLNARFKGEKAPAFLHTLNGTAVAVGRTIIALLETHQQSDGSVVLPSGLHPYLPESMRVIGSK